MRGSPSGFASALLFAVLVIGAPGIAAAQDMPPVLAPLAVAPTAPAVGSKPVAPAAPSAEAAIPPAAPAPVDKPHVVALTHPPVAHQNTKFTALVKRLTTAHSRMETHHVAGTHHPVETHHIVAARMLEPSPPPGMPVPPPGYYEPGYGPGPYQRLVYSGPPPSFYGGWGYRGRPPFYP
jgi:hypothetical protein